MQGRTYVLPFFLGGFNGEVFNFSDVFDGSSPSDRKLYYVPTQDFCIEKR